MKKDYLWDKTGSDVEIEELENTLKTFRMKDTNAPQLPQKTFAFDKAENKKTKFALRSAFATFACLGLFIISIGVFQVSQIGNQEFAQNDSTETIAEKPKIENTLISKSNALHKTKIEKQIAKPKFEKLKFNPKPKKKKRFAKVRKPINTKIKRNPTIAKNFKPKQTNIAREVKTVKLTKEEKNAYEQLMKALAITGSQMRIVREKINGAEEKTAVKQTRR